MFVYTNVYIYTHSFLRIFTYTCVHIYIYIRSMSFGLMWSFEPEQLLNVRAANAELRKFLWDK